MEITIRGNREEKPFKTNKTVYNKSKHLISIRQNKYTNAVDIHVFGKYTIEEDSNFVDIINKN